jgi:hypothetical protein
MFYCFETTTLDSRFRGIIKYGVPGIVVEVGKQFGRDVATLSTTMRRLGERAERSERLKVLMAQLKSTII